MTQKEIFKLLWDEASEINENGTIVRQITSQNFSKIADKILLLNKAFVSGRSEQLKAFQGWQLDKGYLNHKTIKNGMVEDYLKSL